MAKKPFYRFGDTAGDGSGDKTAIGDYTTPQDFAMLHPAGADTICYCERMIVHIEDGNNFSADKYDLLTTLTNGISILLLDAAGATLQDITDGMPVKTNASWGRHCYDIKPSNFGQGNDYIQVSWTFEKAGAPIRMNPGLSIVARLRDNFTGLIDHTFMFQGYCE